MPQGWERAEHLQAQVMRNAANPQSFTVLVEGNIRSPKVAAVTLGTLVGVLAQQLQLDPDELIRRLQAEVSMDDVQSRTHAPLSTDED